MRDTKRALTLTSITVVLLLPTTVAAKPPALKADRGTIRFFVNHPRLAITPAGQRALWLILGRLATQVRTLQAVPADCRGASAAACSWYEDGATQCEVAHEGAFTTDTNPVYKGRFQTDSTFERGTALGRRMQDALGRSNRWPPWAQIEHAYEVWLVRGWHPWPPYYVFHCSQWKGIVYG